MVKNAKMFKERFEVIRQELLRIRVNHYGYESNNLSDNELFERNENPDNERLALMVLRKAFPRTTFIINNKSYFHLETIIFDTFPEIKKQVEDAHIARAKELNKETELFKCKVEKVYKELLDKVLFNGKDPLEAINELQALKPKK